MPPIIQLEDVWWKYQAGVEDITGKPWMLKGVTLDIEQGEFLAITGQNGAGKTTLCLTLNGIIPNNFLGAYKGNVTVDGKNTREHKVHVIAPSVGMVFQNPESQFIRMRVDDEIAFGPENLSLPIEEIADRIDWALDLVRMGGFHEKPPRELSGGQKQRVALAASLALKPKILILDEPTSQIDPIGKEEVFEIVGEVKKKYQSTIVMVEHRTQEITEFADRVILLNDGKIELEGTPSEFFSKVDFCMERGVFPPQVTQLFDKLHQHGVYSPVNGLLPVTLDKAIEYIQNIVSKM